MENTSEVLPETEIPMEEHTELRKLIKDANALLYSLFTVTYHLTSPKRNKEKELYFFSVYSRCL